MKEEENGEDKEKKQQFIEKIPISEEIELAFLKWNELNPEKRLDDPLTFKSCLNIVPEIEAFYRDFTYSAGLERNLPEHFKEAGATAEDWAEVTTLFEEWKRLSAIKARFEKDQYIKLKEKLEEKERELEPQFDNLKQPLLLINNINVRCLPFNVQCDIAKVVDKEERKNKIKEEIEKQQQFLIREWKNNRFVDPFEELRKREKASTPEKKASGNS